jgi:osmotically-inducible protein OsmY
VFSFVLWIPAALRNVPLCLAVVSEGRRHDGFSVLEQQESHMADDWRRDDRERFRRDPYSRDRAYGRGTDYEGDGTIARRGFGNDSSGYEGRGSHVSERDRGYMGSTERYRGDRGDRPYWTEDRFGGSDYERNLSQRRGPEDYEEPGYGDWGSPSLRRDRDTDYSRSSEDYRRRSGGYGRDHDTEAAYRELSDPGDGYVGRTRNHGFSGGRGHGFWREAVDEVKSWFGDDDRDTRYGRDRSESDWDRPSHRGRGPKGHTRSDERIREDVNDRLTDDPHIDASEIDVQVSNREVTLTGTVNSRFEKRHAEDIAESVSGVTHVQNNLRVQQQNLHSGSAGLGTAGMGSLGNTTGSAGVAMSGQSATGTRGGGTASSGRITGGTTGTPAGMGGSGSGPQGTGLGGSEVGPQGSEAASTSRGRVGKVK